LTGGTLSALAGAEASIPQIATRQAAAMFRIIDSISVAAP
jgi:hypothetical protein